jgi:hypothetical protein
MKNTPEIFKTLNLRADMQTAAYRSSMNIEEMDDDFLEDMSRLACNRREWYERTLERYKTMETLPGNTLEILKESKRAERLGRSFEREYRERLKNPDSALFPVYPADITADRFRELFTTMMKSPRYNESPAFTAAMLISKALPHNKDAINEFLKNSGCVDEETTLKVLKSWIEGENKRTPRKTCAGPDEDTGIAL